MGSDGRDEDDGDRNKKMKIKPEKTKDQNVSLAREECHLSLFSILNLPGVEGILSRWDICLS